MRRKFLLACKGKMRGNFLGGADMRVLEISCMVEKAGSDSLFFHVSIKYEGQVARVASGAGQDAQVLVQTRTGTDGSGACRSSTPMPWRTGLVHVWEHAVVQHWSPGRARIAGRMQSLALGARHEDRGSVMVHGTGTTCTAGRRWEHARRLSMRGCWHWLATALVGCWWLPATSFGGGD
ncbi:UDP-3-O-acylglucosamine N-acyltransferase [Striga asiatica]|uniref:UDP-3-O-acylglucosamine N-acyltransferase n=1 Tax=Striga asiatica TaxID=4170 RepID=A0A5A7QBH6_STRAF|nr:UDP-3-O-acylglucosamine N-acyltransferase [Striga asiatica]